MELMFAICRPQPNWMPKKPKLRFQIAGSESGRRVFIKSMERFAELGDDTLAAAIMELNPVAQRRGFFSDETVELLRRETPLPIALGAAGPVQRRRRRQIEEVLHRDNREARRRRQQRADHRPGGRGTVELKIIADFRRVVWRETLEPAARGEIVVRAGVRNAVGRIEVRQVDVVRVVTVGELEHL